MPRSDSAGRKECRYASVLALDVWYEYVCGFFESRFCLMTSWWQLEVVHIF